MNKGREKTALANSSFFALYLCCAAFALLAPPRPPHLLPPVLTACALLSGMALSICAMTFIGRHFPCPLQSPFPGQAIFSQALPLKPS